MLNKNIQKKIVNNVIEHIKKFTPVNLFMNLPWPIGNNWCSHHCVIQVPHFQMILHPILTLKTLGVTSI